MAALLLLGLVAAPLGVMAQASGCVQLTGSTMCPAFTDQYINPGNLSGSWPFMSNVDSVASFDSQLAEYLTNQYEFRATKYQRQLGCQNTSTTFTLQYARTFLCSEFTQISYSAGCYPAGATRRMACQSTCLMFAASENNLVANTVACNPIANYPPRAGNLTKDFAACTDWTSLATNDTSTCVLGQLNEPNCGYGTSTSQLCSRCNPAQGSVDSCCGVASSNVTAFCGFSLAAAQILPTSATNPTSVSQTALLPTSTGAYTGGAGSAPAATSTAGSGGSGSGVGQSDTGASTTGGSSGLSGGAIAGIVIGAIAGVLLIGGLIAFFLLRRRKANSAASRSPSSFNDNEKAAAFGAGGAAAAAGGAGALAGGAAMKEKSLEKPYGSSAALAKPYNAPSSTNASSRNLPSPSLADSGDGSKGLAAAAGLGATGAGAGAAAASASRPVSGAPTAGSGSSGSNDGRNLVSSYRDQYSSTDITPGSDVVAIYSYQPNLPDELTLEPEMIVTVRKIFDDGWASGRITRGAVAGRPSEGAFPLVVCTALGADMNDNASTSSSISSRRAMTAESGGVPMSSGRSGRTSSIGASSFDTAHETGPESVDEEHTARQGGFLSGIVGGRR